MLNGESFLHGILQTQNHPLAIQERSMKKRLTMIAASMLVVNTAYAEWPTLDGSEIYLGAEIGKSSSKLKSGGFNTAGPHQNTNSDKESGNLYGLKIGIKPSDRWRFDIGLRRYENNDYITSSFQPPTPTFFYNSRVKSKAGIVSAYYDFYKFENLNFYSGAGIGVSRTKVSTNDTVVEGSETETNFAWQVELGADYPLSDALSLNAGIRYVDLGKTTVDLKSMGSGAPAGDFTADLSSKEVFLGLRYTF